MMFGGEIDFDQDLTDEDQDDDDFDLPASDEGEDGFMYENYDLEFFVFFDLDTFLV